MKSAKKLRLAIVCGTMNVGGGETMSAKLAGYIDHERFDVKYFVISDYIDNQIAARLRDDGTDFVCLGLPTSFSFKNYKVFKKAMKEFKPDVIHDHLFSPYSWVWALLHNKPMITTIHGNPGKGDRRVKAIMKAKSVQGHLRVIACSKKTMEQTKDCYELKDKFLGTIYNPISVDDFKAHESVENTADFLAMGRLNKLKNYPLMLRAFKRVSEKIPSAHLSIAGSGPLEAELKALTDELQLSEKVTFLGNVTDIPTLLSQKSVLLLSSVSEACPMVILEAMASGVPTVATDVGGVPELISDNGIVVPSEDEEAFAEAMIKITENTDLLDEMREKCLKYSKNYDKKVITRLYEQEYLSLTKKGKLE